MKKYILIALLFTLIFSFISCGGKEDDPVQNPSAVFTDPDGTSQNKATLTRYIRSAKKTLDVAQFLMKDRDLAQELINAKNRGVVVRVVGDNETQSDGSSFWNMLISNGINVVFDRSTNYTHNKVVLLTVQRSDGFHKLDLCLSWSEQ
jgi:phosphatidylserine/phosphatidylglycerophosphate/cardiolipin synthase-like enzyme